MNHNDFYLYIESSVGEQEKMMTWNLEVLTEREKKHFHNRIIKQFAQRGCRNSILGGFQDLPGESAKQSGLNSNVDPALSRKPGWKTSQSSFQNEWLGDSKASEAIKMFLLLPLPYTCWYDTSLPLSVQNEEQVLWSSSVFSSSLFYGLSSSWKHHHNYDAKTSDQKIK